MNFLNTQERQELVYKLELNAELNRRQRINGLKWFIPNGKQEDFINKIGSGEVFIGLFSAGNGVGKTALLANIVGSIVFGNKENPFFDKPLFNNFRYPKRGRIASTTKNIEEIGAIQTELKKWFPVGKYQTRKNQKRYDSEYIYGDWVVDIMTYAQDATEFESATLGFIVFDEPPPMKILNASIARMRKGGVVMIFMTPLDEGGEIIDELCEKESTTYNGVEIGRVDIVYADIEDNCKEHGIRGQLEHAHIAQMMSRYDQDEIEARAKGKPTHMVGRIYNDFENKDPYVVDPISVREDWIIINILDPHDGIPFALSWVGYDKTGQFWVFDEFPYDDLAKAKGCNLTYVDYAKIIREKEGRNISDIRIIDPYFGNKRFGNTGKTVKEELSNLGLDFEDGDTSLIETGHKRVREFLKYDKSRDVSALNHPKLHMFSSCANHIKSLLRYKRKLLRSGEVKDKVQIDETYKHFCDNIRHLVMKEELFKNNSKGYQTKEHIFSGAGGW